MKVKAASRCIGRGRVVNGREAPREKGAQRVCSSLSYKESKTAGDSFRGFGKVFLRVSFSPSLYVLEQKLVLSKERMTGLPACYATPGNSASLLYLSTEGYFYVFLPF